MFLATGWSHRTGKRHKAAGQADGARLGGGAPPPLRQAELPLRGRRVAARAVVLSYSEGGRTRFVMLPAGEVAAVRAAVERYRAERARLHEAAEAGRAALVARLGQAR